MAWALDSLGDLVTDSWESVCGLDKTPAMSDMADGYMVVVGKSKEAGKLSQAGISCRTGNGRLMVREKDANQAIEILKR